MTSKYRGIRVAIATRPWAHASAEETRTAADKAIDKATREGRPIDLLVLADEQADELPLEDEPPLEPYIADDGDHDPADDIVDHGDHGGAA